MCQQIKDMELTLSKEDRININDKFSYLMASGEILKTFSKEEVFNYFTGKGGLHGLEFSNYDCFHSYTKAKQEVELGAFFTPDSLFKRIHDLIKIKDNYLVADLSFGKGGFFNGIKNESNCYGCEYDSLNHSVATTVFPKANLIKGDLKYYQNDDVSFDVIFGNPPFNLRWDFENDQMASQLVYVKKSYKLLKENGLFVLLVPCSFLKDEMMDQKGRDYMSNRFNLVSQYELPLDAFSAVGVQSFATKLMFFQKKTLEEGCHENDYRLFNDPHVDADNFFEQIIAPVYSELDSVMSKRLNKASKNRGDSTAKVAKLLYDIQRHPKVSEYYGKCNAYYNKYLHQKQPKDMNDKEWDKKKLTINKVIANLKLYLKKQNPKKFVKKGTLIKCDDGIKRAKVPLSYRSINQMVYSDAYFFENKKYEKLIQKKRKQMLNQMQVFDDMKQDKKIAKFLKNVSLKGFDDGQIVNISLNGIQASDTNKILQKYSSYLQWEQGTGKTVTGIAQIKYRMKYTSINKTIIAGPSIAINGTWTDMLKLNGLNNLNITSIADVYNMMSEDYDTITISFYYINKYKKQLKKMQKGKKIFFILDEADNYSNPSSTRTKSGLDIFRRATYKTLMSGTSIRNNIVEFFPQMELMYNNGYNMIDTCSTLYKFDPKAKADEEALTSQANSNQHKPFFPYKKGFNEFKLCFNPSKATVFGIQKQDQKVFNADDLANMLSYTVITRTFEEVTGRKIYKVEPVHIEANQDELDLQKEIKEGIQKYYGVYINSTGNSRKDAMLRLLHQMNLLFKSCSDPMSFDEYKNDTFSKLELVKEYLNDNKDFAVLAGVKVAEMMRYKRIVEELYPEKTIYYIDGKVSIAKRKKIIAEMSNNKNSVLICTQQSLSSSISINFIDTILLTSLDWNLSKMSQFYFRFIRYNSKGFKTVNLLTLKGSIESNLLKVVLDKDNLVQFMKTRKMTNENKMGVDLDFLLSLVVDKEELQTKETETK